MNDPNMAYFIFVNDPDTQVPSLRIRLHKLHAQLKAMAYVMDPDTVLHTLPICPT